MMDVNVTRALSGHTSVDHVDSRLIIAVQDGGAGRRKAEVGHDGAHVASMLGGGISGKELRVKRIKMLKIVFKPILFRSQLIMQS